MLNGQKTYTLMGLLAIAAIAALITGNFGPGVALQTAFGALSLSSLRAAIKKLEVVSKVIPQTYLSRIGGMIPGTKTYLTAGACAIFALLAFGLGEQSFLITAAVVAASLGLSTIRLAVARVQSRFEDLTG